MHDLVCIRCGASQGKCVHTYDSDYLLQPREAYRQDTIIIRVLGAMILVFIGVIIWLW